MSVLILTDANLRFLTRVLMTDYEVRSAHASELIAALCGQRTYAALKVAISTFTGPPAVRIDTDHFEQRHSELGYDRSSGEWMRMSLQHLAFPDRPWLECKSKQKEIKNNWYYKCQKNGHPFIVIEQKTKYSYFHWDCMSINPSNEGHLKNKELTNILYRIYTYTARGKEPKSFFEGCEFTGEVEKLSLRSARHLANDFFMELTPWAMN